MTKGRLILVVGPSGAGKDTLMAAAAERLASDPRFVFPRRIVTREAVADLEDHDTISRAEFDKRVAADDYTLSWEAHGLGYIIPASVKTQIDEGHIAICNGSRQIVSTVLEQNPASAIIVITADREIRARRLMGRGRETETDIRDRLAREVPPLPQNDRIFVVDNSDALETGIAAFITAVHKAAALETA